jgi:hypothetical protein
LGYKLERLVQVPSQQNNGWYGLHVSGSPFKTVAARTNPTDISTGRTGSDSGGYNWQYGINHRSGESSSNTANWRRGKAACGQAKSDSE